LKKEESQSKDRFEIVSDSEFEQILSPQSYPLNKASEAKTHTKEKAHRENINTKKTNKKMSKRLKGIESCIEQVRDKFSKLSRNVQASFIEEQSIDQQEEQARLLQEISSDIQSILLVSKDEDSEEEKNDENRSKIFPSKLRRPKAQNCSISSLSSACNELKEMSTDKPQKSLKKKIHNSQILFNAYPQKIHNIFLFL